MYTDILKKMKWDKRITQAINLKRKQTHKKFLIYAATVFVFASLLCILAKFEIWKWLGTFFLAITAVIVPFYFLQRKSKDPKIFLGKIERMEENRKIVPPNGTETFGGFHSRTEEVYELLIAITNEKGVTHVIFCPPQYEKILQLGDTLLCHSALPYPAHLSNPTKCICMHCDTMQASENRTCITCGGALYSLYTLQP